MAYDKKEVTLPERTNVATPIRLIPSLRLLDTPGTGIAGNGCTTYPFLVERTGSPVQVDCHYYWRAKPSDNAMDEDVSHSCVSQ